MMPSPARYQREGALSLFKHTALSATLLCAFAGSVHAQTAPLPVTGANEAASERAKREGDKVFQWIRIHADKPRKAAAAPAPEKAAAATPPAPVKIAAKAPAKPADSGITETVQPLKTAARSDEPAATKVAAPAQPEPVTSQVAAAQTDAAAPLVGSAASPQVEIEEDASLTPIFKSEPDFPGALMRQLRKGLVQVAFTVQPDGTVSQVHAVSSTHPRLAPSAVSTVAQWKFQPVRHAQQAVVDLGFNLD